MYQYKVNSAIFFITINAVEYDLIYNITTFLSFFLIFAFKKNKPNF